VRSKPREWTGCSPERRSAATDGEKRGDEALEWGNHAARPVGGRGIRSLRAPVGGSARASRYSAPTSCRRARSGAFVNCLRRSRVGVQGTGGADEHGPRPARPRGQPQPTRPTQAPAAGAAPLAVGSLVGSLGGRCAATPTTPAELALRASPSGSVSRTLLRMEGGAASQLPLGRRAPCSNSACLRGRCRNLPAGGTCSTGGCRVESFSSDADGGRAALDVLRRVTARRRYRIAQTTRDAETAAGRKRLRRQRLYSRTQAVIRVWLSVRLARTTRAERNPCHASGGLQDAPGAYLSRLCATAFSITRHKNARIRYHNVHNWTAASSRGTLPGRCCIFKCRSPVRLVKAFYSAYEVKNRNATPLLHKSGVSDYLPPPRPFGTDIGVNPPAVYANTSHAATSRQVSEITCVAPKGVHIGRHAT